MPQEPAILVRADGTRIAHHHTPAAAGNGTPGIVFLGGFKSDMEGGKALRLEALAVLDDVTRGPQILVGSSMGGWIALLAALRRTDRVAGVVGVAPAPDFVVRMEGELSAEQRATLARDGRFERPSAYSDDPYVITRALIEDGKRHLLMAKPIPLDLPIRILHGMRDDAVPWQLSLTLCEALTSDDVRVQFVKSGDHRLSEESELDLLCSTVDEVGRRSA